MTRPPPLTVADVQRSGGWNLAYAKILALGSADGYGFSVVDSNGDQRECYTDYWRSNPEGGWAPQGGSSGADCPDGVCAWADDQFDFRAAYACTEDPDQFDPGASTVGTVTITVTRTTPTLSGFISDLLERVPISSAADLESVAEGIGLALLLVESDEPALGLRELVTWLTEHGLALTRNELDDLAALAGEHGLFDDEWGQLEQQPKTQERPDA